MAGAICIFFKKISGIIVNNIVNNEVNNGHEYMGHLIVTPTISQVLYNLDQISIQFQLYLCIDKNTLIEILYQILYQIQITKNGRLFDEPNTKWSSCKATHACGTPVRRGTGVQFNIIFWLTN